MNIVDDIATRRYHVWLATLIFFILLGIGAWIFELVYGLGSTGMRGVISWGLYICTFAFFIKLSAGGLIVASSAEIFHIEALRPLARLGALTAAVCVSLATITLIPDLGRPGRILNLLLHPNWRSPMIWDAIVVGAYFILAIWELLLMSTAPATEKSRRQLRILAFVGLPAAFALHSITAWIFGLQVSHTFWNTALMAPLFVVSAILSGTALMTVIAWLLQKFAKVELQEATWKKLSGLMAITLAVDLFFVLSEYITVLWANVPNETLTLRMMLPGGQFAILFWLEWIFGGKLAFLLLVIPRLRRRVNLVATSAVLILVGVYAFQVELTIVGMTNPLIQLAPGISLGTFTSGHSVFQFVGQYTPTWVEYLIILGVAAFAAMLVTLGLQHFKFQELHPRSEESDSINLRKAAQA